MKQETTEQWLYAKIRELPVIDTHEHLPWDEQEALAQPQDILSEYLSHYLSSDLRSAGASGELLNFVRDCEHDLRMRWEFIRPYWDACRHTGYARALDIAVKELYGFDGITQENLLPVNEAFLRARKPGRMHALLREHCGIEISVLDRWVHLTGENPLFLRAYAPAELIMPYGIEGCADPCAYLQQKHGRAIQTLEDWKWAMERELDAVLAAYHSRVLKCALAYDRTLAFAQVAQGEAEALFARWLETPARGRGQFPAALQDYLMHHLLTLANARALTLQLHTGLLEGNGNTLSNSDPMLLNPLFGKYPRVTFDLFHISYPFEKTACALAKMFPNVTLDLCWAHIISPSACRAALHDFLDAVPYTKISAFGGDYLFADGVAGHLELSRQSVSRVLAEKVADGVFSKERALEIAKALYYDNPKRIFQI